ncbi:MAG: aryl-alcohol dehydrogenase, partial [Firmicutes bacterium]|nr:aryl-alcohol dehydrogenase [Bacillota bacterium]
LLLMDTDTLPSFFDPVRECLKNYHRTIRRWEMTPVEAALGFVAGLEEIDVVICGVNNHRQLQELTAQTQKPVDRKKFSRFAVTDEDILNPSLWRL